MTSQLKHCDDGPPPEGLLLSEHLVEKDSIQLQTYTKSLEMTNRHNPRKRPRSVMQESVQSINETTLNDKSQISDNIIQNTKLSATSAQGLNWKRRGFVTLLERIYTGGIEEVVVTRKV